MKRNVRAKIHSCHSPKMPAVARSPVTSRGVSAANCVAAMLRPAFQPGSVRPARKYSSRFLVACFRFRKPALMA